MTRIFTSGAEAGTKDIWDATDPYAFSVSTAQKRTGNYSYCFGNFYSYLGYCSHTFSANKTEIYMRIAFRISALGAGNVWRRLLKFFDSAGGNQLTLSVNYITLLFGVHTGAGPDIQQAPVASGGVLVLNEWTCIEIRYLVDNDPGTGRVVVKQDGNIIINYTGDTQATGLTEIRTFHIGSISAGETFEGYVDDIAINDVAGSVNNSWIGRGGIYGIVPDGVGNYTDLIASAAPAWDCINEVPPSDADYVYESTVDKKSTYTLTNLTPTTGTIACINVIMRAKLDAVGTGNIARLIRSNGVDGQGADVGLSTSPSMIQENVETDPSGGGAWTITRVNALEAGAVVR